MKKFFVIFLGVSALFNLSCKNQGKPGRLFEQVVQSGIKFSNTVKDNDTINILNYRNFYNGGGVATGDVNNDGYADVFFTANQGANKLFLNEGIQPSGYPGFKFKDISTKAGFKEKLQFSTGVVMADINADGWLDIFVCNAGSMHDPALRSDQLFINNHDLTFTESAEKYGLQDSGYTTQVSFFDYDLDGDLDCFRIDNSPVPVNSLGYAQQRSLPSANWNVPPYLRGGGDHLYRNDNGYFREVSQQAGIHGTLVSFGLGVTVGDVNDDHYPDIYVSNDFFERDYLYINQKNGTFKDDLENLMQHNSYASMGADFGDVNNDGHPEIFTTDMLPSDDYRLKTTLSFDDIDQYRLKERNGFFHQFLQNTLQLNTGNGNFKDIASFSGVNASEWSWGALMFDADNDGFTDLYVCNGIYRDLTNQDFLSFDAEEIKLKMMATGKKELAEIVNKIPSIAVPNKMYRNLGNLKFADQGEEWGFTGNSFSNGAAYADMDNDGDLDIIVSNVNEPAFVFKNNSRQLNKNNFIGVQLKGKQKNTFAVGSQILVYNKGEILNREIIPSRGFQSSVDYKQVIGIGSAAQVDSMLIIWPDITCTKIEQPEINKYHVFTQPATGIRLNHQAPHKSAPLLQITESIFEKHIDDDYIDFYYERGIPVMLSHEGPKASVADVNNDGFKDIFIGGTLSKAGQLYLQDGKGGFIKKEDTAFKALTGFVDGAVLFFDCDNDSDQDLLLASAGNAARPASRELQHRLFVNDGKGNFQISLHAFPVNKDNIAVAVEHDFDDDGDLDLFMGARCVSGVYGITPQSHLYLNNGKGVFFDMPPDKTKGIVDAGMITGAVWADVYGGTEKELILVGEWMPPKIFQYQRGLFAEIKSNLSTRYGWWQTVAVADLNSDGKKDLVLGNIGENFYLRPDAKNPVKLWLNDFDENGEIDKIISRTVEGKDKPVFMKNESENGLPFLKKQNLRHSVYATKAIQDLFNKDQLEKTLVKQVNFSSSCIAYNKGDGNFSVTPLPASIQLSSVKVALTNDVNEDGFVDLLIGGNEFNFQPQLGRLDASFGDVLLNDGKGNFSILPNTTSGLSLRGQVRGILPVEIVNKTHLLFLQTDEHPLLYKVNNHFKKK